MHLISRRTAVSIAAGAPFVPMLGGAAGAATQQDITPRLNAEQAGKTALLILDMQLDFLQVSGKLPVAQDQVPNLIVVVNKLLGGAAERGWIPLNIVNDYSSWDITNLFRNYAAISGTPGAALDPRVQMDGARRFTKNVSDAFTNPELVKFIDSNRIGKVIIGGVFAEACVTSTARGAIRRGLTPFVVSDAVASGSDAVRDAAITSLRSTGVIVASSSEIFDSRRLMPGEADERHG
jgi:nicotinamidase-related amidase